MSYDPECYRLAEHFLTTQASERLKSGLAQAIQTAAEDWIEAGSIEVKTRLAKTGSVFSRDNCIFDYCPHLDHCQKACLLPRRSA